MAEVAMETEGTAYVTASFGASFGVEREAAAAAAAATTLYLRDVS